MLQFDIAAAMFFCFSLLMLQWLLLGSVLAGGPFCSILMQGYAIVALCVYSSHHYWVLFFGFWCTAYIRSFLYFLPRVAGVSYTLSSMNIFSVYLSI